MRRAGRALAITRGTITAAAIASRLTAAGLKLQEVELARLSRYLDLLGRWNRVHNLTAITEPAELIGRHLLESLALGPLLRGLRIADIGTGAGLPGIPLAICHPDREFTLIESRRKRVAFLRHAIATLGIANARVAHSRAEDLPTGAAFATVLARAVAPPAELLAITRPLTVPGSILLLLTSAELGRRIAGLAEDFVERPVGKLPTGRMQSSIVVLERVARPRSGTAE